MPELPEVETIIKGLKRKIVGRYIKSAWFDHSNLIKKPSVSDFEKEIKGLLVKDVRRRAKNILIDLSNNKILLIHLKMTGHLLFGKWDVKNGKVSAIEPKEMKERTNEFIHFIIFFEDGWQMALSDMRKFAKIMLGDKIEIEEELKNLGPEPLKEGFDLNKFKDVIRSKKGKIKSILMDQNVIAGIGNIYSDEILWEAKINPFIKSNELNDKELKRIFLAIKKILKNAVKDKGSSVGDYRDSSGKRGNYSIHHNVYRKEGEGCPRCGKKIIRRKIGGRSSYFCDFCSKID